MTNLSAPTAEQTEAMDYISTELRKVFPTSCLFVRIRRIIGENNIHFNYMNAATAAECPSGIAENDPAFMSFSIWNNERADGFHIPRPTTHGDVFHKAGISRFVTIKGSTEMECAVKLVKWMVKHSDKFLALTR